MIINFSLSNAFSFKDKQNLSMVASSSRKDDINFANVINVDNVDSPRLLKSALVYGANASGKSNFIKTVSIMRDIVLNSVQAIEFSLTRFVMPFLLDDHGTQNASEMEVEFVIDNFKYRYGFAVKHGKIQEEWLYYTPNSRETMLFERNEAEIEYNKTAFVEASAFVDGKFIQKTREDVPFISVVAGFNGEHASRVVKWFRNIVVISGSNETAFTQITLKLLNESEDFVVWLKKILPAFQICDIFLDEINPDFSLNNIQTDDNNIKSLFESIQSIVVM